MSDLKLYHTEPGALEVGIDESGRGCEFEDGLVLTNNGWKPYYKIDIVNDLVLSYTSQHKIIWQKIDKVLSWSVDEELIQMKHRYIDILVTKDHHFDVLVGSYRIVQRKKVTDLKDNDYLPYMREKNQSGKEISKLQCKHLLSTKKLIQKKGTVFCLALPDHHNFYIKRSGSGYFTGNSFVGDVFAGAVFWDPECTSPLIDDSKKLNERKRLMAYDFVRENSLAYGVGRATAQEIDDHNILQATLKAMHRAVDACQILPELILVDGTQFKIYENRREDAVPHTTIIDGDTLYYSIAAASILAKVERDRYIVDLVDTHPELGIYQLAKNKGYGSSAHIKAIRNWGISPCHRKTFGICKQFAK